MKFIKVIPALIVAFAIMSAPIAKAEDAAKHSDSATAAHVEKATDSKEGMDKKDCEKCSKGMECKDCKNGKECKSCNKKKMKKCKHCDKDKHGDAAKEEVKEEAKK